MPATRIVVNFAEKPSYDVRVGAGVMEGLGARLRAVLPATTGVLVITDSNVGPLYWAAARNSLRAAGYDPVRVMVPAGEESKRVEVLSEVWAAMAAKKLDRNCCVVALGGGVVGDLAGFAAATWLRGVSFVQVPTSLLAMVDSSVGGKTGVDLPAGKNLVGAFLQPAYVCADTSALETLPAREWTCGFGEVAKSAVISGRDFFDWLVHAAPALRAHDSVAVEEAIARCVVFKASAVTRDETERAGVRECLNFGHTLGHAIEKLAGYGTYSHGACVAEGMRFACRLGAQLCGMPASQVEEVDALLDALGCDRLGFSAPADDVIDAMKSDKKTRGGVIRFVLPHEIGAWSVEAVDEAVLREHLQAWAG